MNNFKDLGANASKEDVLFFRFIKLFQSIKQVSEILIELSVNFILFLTSLLAWIFQFNSYLIFFFKNAYKFICRITDLVTLQQKIYILITIIILYILIYIINKLYRSIKRLRRHYHMKWSVLINHLLYILSPYLIFIFTIYLPLCIVVPKFYFEAIIIRTWILWIPIIKSITLVYNSLYGNYCHENTPIYKVISILEKYNNTDIILNLLETISCRIGNKYKISLQPGKSNSSLTLLNSKSTMVKEIVQIKAIQCWVDYFNLWLIYFFLKNYILGSSIKYISSIIIKYFKVVNILILDTINNFSSSNLKLIFLASKYKPVSFIIQPIGFILKFPTNIIKYILLLTINMNWKYLLISIVVLNVLLQIKFIQDHDSCFSILFKDSRIKIGIGSSSCFQKIDNDDEDCNKDDDIDEDNELEDDDQDERINNQSDESNDENFSNKNHLVKEFESSGKNLIIYEYPSLSMLSRNYLIAIIDWISNNLFGISLFSNFNIQNDTPNSSPNLFISLNPKNITKSLPSIGDELEETTTVSDKKLRRRSSVKPELLHSNTMPHLSLSSGNNVNLEKEGEGKSSSQLKIIANLLENNAIIGWLPESWRAYCLFIGENMMNKSSKFKYWILVAIILIGQVPQWIILLFPSFIVNLIGCMIFGYIYPLIMSLRTSSNIGISYYSLNTKMGEKLQTWIIYLIIFNVLNEIFSMNSFHMFGIIAWIPFKIHIYYLIILLLQLTSSIIPILTKQVKFKKK
ncbi:hypothetical protein [Cryptosporidium parvum Iowa II]|uniref:Uncharacterized protein n=2 Tax=Cryptosporidium parvum TaxID=5807 RepID=Q5CT81_CRYPI|nr:hypothetical protein [Cryptosporidium parvum Iowa II]EAK88631.1 hypothetical protein with 12 transmembrane domains [Cryptosporidium parvum Iowa II]QOY42822.1 Uncharacterized protein CPATCC_0026730 [Cryptosporidium parvum]WRK31199.1 Uncharacterized protein cpbgf_2004060 [Cryptosporidium parvum]|eukprot:QOY42822.1 hypothetical protein CPATCC_000501 [Cryptosporidium parvum]